MGNSRLLGDHSSCNSELQRKLHVALITDRGAVPGPLIQVQTGHTCNRDARVGTSQHPRRPYSQGLNLCPEGNGASWQVLCTSPGGQRQVLMKVSGQTRRSPPSELWQPGAASSAQMPSPARWPHLSASTHNLSPRNACCP